ncbi:GAF domain-containing protein, partial [Actinospica durhamensis]
MNNLGLVSIGSAAAAAGVPEWRLRSWEASGLLTPARSAAGYRLYSSADIRRAVELREASSSTNRLGVFAATADQRSTRETATQDIVTPAAPGRQERASGAVEARRMRILRRLAHAIRHVDDLGHVLGTALESALGMVDAEIGALSYADISTQRYVLAAQRGLSPAYVRGIDTWNLHEGLAGESFGLREPLTIVDLSTNSAVARDVVHAERLRGYLCVPLLRGQRRLGIIEVFDREPRVFSADEVQSLELIGASVSSIVESLVLTQELSFLRDERAKVLREWTVQALATADTERVELVRALRSEASGLEGGEYGA